MDPCTAERQRTTVTCSLPDCFSPLLATVHGCLDSLFCRNYGRNYVERLARDPEPLRAFGIADAICFEVCQVATYGGLSHFDVRVVCLPERGRTGRESPRNPGSSTVGMGSRMSAVLSSAVAQSTACGNRTRLRLFRDT